MPSARRPAMVLSAALLTPTMRGGVGCRERERRVLVVAVGVPHLVGEVEQFLDSGLALGEPGLELGSHRMLLGRPSAVRRGARADTEQEPPSGDGAHGCRSDRERSDLAVPGVRDHHPQLHGRGRLGERPEPGETLEAPVATE